MSTPKPAEVDLLRSFVVLPAETGCNAPMLDTNEPTVVNLAGHLNILENYSGSTSSADHKTAATPGNPSGSPGTYDELKKIQEMRAMYLKKGRQLKATARDTPVEFLASLTDLDLDILKQEHIQTLGDLVRFQQNKRSYGFCKDKIPHLDTLVNRARALLDSGDM